MLCDSLYPALGDHVVISESFLQQTLGSAITLRRIHHTTTLDHLTCLACAILYQPGQTYVISYRSLFDTIFKCLYESPIFERTAIKCHNLYLWQLKRLN